MPSPFPGMDPYLEAPDIWPDFHDALAGEIRAELNFLLPYPYYARLEVRPEVGIVGSELLRHQFVELRDASLIEIDLLRSGDRLLPNADLEAYLLSLEPQPAYLVLVHRAWRRSGVEMAYQLFAMSLREVLPCISVPLREGEDEVSLDLQWLFNHAYDRGPYRRGAVDYQREPEPPLEPDDTEWLAQRLRDQ